MSKTHTTPGAILEWSPDHAAVLNLVTRATRVAGDVGEAAADLNGQRDVVAAVSRRTAFVRAVRVPNVGRAEIGQILRMQAAQLFPVPPAELAMDFQLTDDVSPEGRLAIIGAIRESNLSRLHAEARGAGLRVRRVLPAAFGSVIVARELGLSECAVVQKTHEGSAIDVIAGGELRYSRMIPATNPEALEAEVQRTFAAAGVPPARVVAVGDLALPGAIETVISPLEALGSAQVETIGLNLEPSAVVTERERRKESGRMRLALMLWAAAALLALTVYLDRSDAQKKIDDQQSKANARLNRLRKDSERVLDRASDAKRIELALNQAFTPPQRITDTVAVVTGAVPPGVWLTGMTMERGRTMTIRGTAKGNDVLTQYLARLTRQPRLRDVRLVFATNTKIEETPVVNFSVSAFAVGNVPLAEEKARTKAKTTRTGGTTGGGATK